MSTKNRSNEIKITRIYDAPVKIVWEAWTDPGQVAKWWGPRGFTLTTHSKELKPGGHWNYTMHGPDGIDYPNQTLYKEVEEYKKLVYDHGKNDEQPALFEVTVNFSEVNGKTRMEMSMKLPTPEAADETRKFIKKAGGDSTWDRLAEYLEKQSSGKERFVINRSFDAPIDVMFEVWSDPKHLAKWLAPTGFEMEFIRPDIREGASSFYVMAGAGGIKMYGRAHYLKIEKPHQLMYTQQFCDQNEQISRHPFAPMWPATMLTVVQFESEGPQRTRVTVTWEVHGDCTPAELDTFIQGRAGMTMGWGGSFDKLEEYLAKQ
jgi:uncharacterized protein YndB with AHSA1/START domain